MLFTNPTTAFALALLFASSPAIAANHGSAGHRNHKRVNVNKRVSSTKPPMFDIHGRQLPGTIQMRKRSSGSNCKAKSSSAFTTTQASYPSSSAVYSATASDSVSYAPASSAYASSNVSYVWVAPTTSSVLVPSSTPTSSSVQAQTTSSIAVEAAAAATSTSSSQYAAATTSSVQTSTVQTSTVQTSTVQTSTVQTSTVQTSTVQTSTVQTSTVQTSTTASAASASSSSSSSSGTYSSMYPNGNKAGISAGDAYNDFENYIGWWYDWTPAPSGHTGTPVAISMLWGGGTVDSTDASRLAEFKALSTVPSYVFGFEEPDCTSGSGSADLSVITGALLWNELIGPLKAKGSLLGSPSMCKQLHETWLTPFKALIEVDWDFTSVHINKNSMTGVQADLDYYWNTYGKPMMINEYACVDDSTSFVPCTDQSEINTFINDIVALFENDYRVIGYAHSNGEGLGDVWPMWVDGALTESGETYLAALKKYH